MTESELRQWLSGAKSAFAEIGNLFAKDTDRGTRRLAWWAEALSDVSPSEADEILGRMLKGDMQTPQYGWSTLPGLIRREVRASNRTKAMLRRANVSDREQRYRCQYCRDSGWVEMWNMAFVYECESAIRQLDDNDRQGMWSLYREWRASCTSGPKFQNYCGLCICEAAEPIKARHRDGKGSVPDGYEPSRRCKFEGGRPIEVKRWLDNRPKPVAEEWQP